jgi:hypothetical protein
MSIYSNNIYDNLSNDEEEIDDKVEIDFKQNNISLLINDEFDKILGYEKNKFVEIITKLEIYEDPEKFLKFQKFFIEFNNDFCHCITSYEIRQKIFNLLKKETYPIKIEYHYLLKDSMTIISCSIGNLINKILLLPKKEIEYLITKYNNISLSNEILPLDPNTQISIDSTKTFNLSNKIIGYLVNKKNGFDGAKNIITNFNLLKSIITKNSLENIYSMLKIIVSNLNVNNYDDDDDDSDTNKIILEKIIYKTNINTDEIDIDCKTTFEINNILIFKLILENIHLDNFSKILSKIYCSSNMLLLEIICSLKKELLDINLEQLKKIIYYGRYNVFIFLFEYIPWKILEILSQSNPFDLKGEKIKYIDDLWDGNTWYNDENEKPIIGNNSEHLKLIKYISLIASEKNFSHIIWTDEIKNDWMETVIYYDGLSHFQSKYYFIKYKDLINFFDVNLNLKDKEDIKKHISLFGRKATWKLLINKFEHDDLILDILMS